MPVTEPMTMLTDYALAVLCAILGVSLASRAARAGGRKVGVWVLAFGTTAAAAVAGGTAHGFRSSGERVGGRGTDLAKTRRPACVGHRAREIRKPARIPCAS